MFTGIIQEVGSVASLRLNPKGAVISVNAPQASRDAALGDSIAVDGACLTVTTIAGATLSFDASAETLRSTTLGSLAAGAKVNIEPALKVGGKMGGHYVTGHIDAVGRIKSKTSEGDAVRYEISAPPEVVHYLVDKGSVTVDGISLTVVKVLEDGFTLVIIPHTLSVTTLSTKSTGSTVNLESDIIGKYVSRFLGMHGHDEQAARDSRITEALARGGFI